MLERFYQIEQTPDVRAFVRAAEDGAREELLLRERDGELEIALLVPPSAGPNPDRWLQVAEGTSHFVYVTNRARMGLPATQLELELQAEVDKFVLLGLGDRTLEQAEALSLHARLFEDVRFLHAAGTELGERYRLANDLAARFVLRLLRRRATDSLNELRRFYRAGLAEKVWLAAA